MQYFNIILINAIVFHACIAVADNRESKLNDECSNNSHKETKIGLDAFDIHLSKVKIGWTEKQLLCHAGIPTNKTNSAWTYIMNESGADDLSGSFIMFSFKINDFKIIDVNRKAGHAAVD